MQDFAIQWYAILSSLNAALVEPIDALQRSAGVPLLSALLFGVLGATSPCQLTTNAGALAYVARSAGSRGAVARGATAYLLAKVLVYTLIGAAVILAGQQLAQHSIPAIQLARKLFGPLMIVLALYLFRLLPLRFTFGQGVADWLEARAGTGAAGAFALGAAFSLAFCPTLFLLFFGLTIPLALSSPIGVLYPGVFAVGTTLPLLVLAAMLSAGLGAGGGYVARARRVDAWIRPVAATVLLLAGLNDTLTYWLL